MCRSNEDQVMEIMRGYTWIPFWLEGEEIRWIKGVVSGFQAIHEGAQKDTYWKFDMDFLGQGRGVCDMKKARYSWSSHVERTVATGHSREWKYQQVFEEQSIGQKGTAYYQKKRLTKQIREYSSCRWERERELRLRQLKKHLPPKIWPSHTARILVILWIPAIYTTLF